MDLWNSTLRGGGNFKSIIDLIHPIGSIIYLNNETDPNKIYQGTTWERIKGKVLVGVDEDDTTFASAGLEGGEKEHTLEIYEMPTRTMVSTQNTTGSVKSTSGTGWNAVNVANGSFIASCLADLNSAKILTTGSNKSHNNLQPYRTVYIWERTK